MTEAEFRALKPGDVVQNDSVNGSRYTVLTAYNDEGYVVTDGGRLWMPECWVRVREAQATATAGYEALEAIYKEALAQAQSGKGKERHSNGEAYEDQKIVSLNMQIGSEHGAIFQACKKAQESVRLQGEHGDAELLGAINYLAAAVLIRRKLRKRAERG